MLQANEGRVLLKGSGMHRGSHRTGCASEPFAGNGPPSSKELNPYLFFQHRPRLVEHALPVTGRSNLCEPAMDSTPRQGIARSEYDKEYSEIFFPNVLILVLDTDKRTVCQSLTNATRSEGAANDIHSCAI